MTYPRSRLFRNYEAQLRSEQKSYPRSRLFQVYEADKTVDRVEHYDVLDDVLDDVLADFEQEPQQISISAQESEEKVTQACDKIDFDNEEEMDFNVSKLNY